MWQEFLTIIREEVGSRVVDTWFNVLVLKGHDILRKEVYLEAPNAFIREWVNKNYLMLCQTHLARLLHIPAVKVLISDTRSSIVDKSDSAADPVSVSLASIASPDAEPEKAAVVTYKGARSVANRAAIYTDSAYSFDNFVVAPNNSLAYAACRAVSENPGYLYNPLFIYGASGLGKTHLLHAIGGAIKHKYKKNVILFQTADRFVSEFINAIRFNKVHQLEEKYRSADVLLVDDVQFIANKGQTQEAFFHIFNVLYDARKQIVFSSDTVPQQMDGIAERLRSRFASGLVVDVQVPSLETKIAILKKKAESSTVVLDDQILHFIAERVALNIRELEGALIRVLAFSSLTQQSITIELVHKVLLRAPTAVIQSVDFDKIMKVITRHYNCTNKQLCSKDRNKHLSFIRHIAMYCMKHLTDKSLRDIGMFFGGRDHTCVVYALEKVERHIQDNSHFSLELRRIENEILKG